MKFVFKQTIKTMEISNLEKITILNSLISILDDGKLGYLDAAEDCGNQDLKSEFLFFSRERATLIIQLQDEVNKLGKSTEAISGPLGILHRAWIDIKSFLTGKDLNAIINTCITGENAAIEIYTKALKSFDSDSGLHYILSFQLATIEKAVAKLKIFEKTYHHINFYES